MQNNSLQLQNKQEIQEDEIDLRELFATIMRGKKIIFLITFIVISLTLLYVLKLPNSYTSSAVLIPAAQEKGANLGGLGVLAAMAGVSIAGDGSMKPDIAFNSLLENSEFMTKFIYKNKILQHYTRQNADENYVFALGYRGIHELFASDYEPIEDEDEALFELIKALKENFTISVDKLNGLITISFTDHDPAYAPKMIEMFLKDGSKHLVENNLNNINKKLHFFEKEMANTQAFELQQSFLGIISKILLEKVMMQVKQYYRSDLLTPPLEPYIRDKTKPKRALILVVSFVTSIILGIFLVFFMDFLRKEKELP